jgi:tRNA threonylcarbamoyladenosine biosynthesis protein TsaB
MPLILNIDTSGETASIALAVDGLTIAEDSNSQQRDHASWIHQAIHELLKGNRFTAVEISAIAVTNGPGSYTGIRVGLATAKGFCYALKIPLITENTLRVMAFDAISNEVKAGLHQYEYFIPMIDARRMEVFTAVYDKNLKEIVTPQALVLEPGTFQDYLTKRTIIFGSGAPKFRQLLPGTEAGFSTIECTASVLSRLSYDKFVNKSFSDIVYSDPLYLKEFYSSEKKHDLIN